MQPSPPPAASRAADGHQLGMPVLPEPAMKPASAFQDLGLKATVDDIVAEARALYLADTAPWVVGYSGGKDSTAVLQIVWTMLRSLEPGERQKPVHVISTDTLVRSNLPRGRTRRWRRRRRRRRR